MIRGMAIKYKNDDRLVWKSAVSADFNSSFLQVDRYSIPSFCQYCYYFQAQVQNCTSVLMIVAKISSTAE